MVYFHRLLDKLFGKYFWQFSICVLVVSGGIAYWYFPIKCTGAENCHFVSVVPMLALLIVILQMIRKLMLDRAEFIENYISKFFVDKTLNTTFYDLIYTYDDDTFKQFECILDKLELDKLDKEKKPIFRPFSKFQAEREIGSRLYHPELFQGSPEEMRLDALLGYFNVIAYRYTKGLLRLDDISGSIGYYLLVIHKRVVIQEYLNLQESDWKTGGYQKFGRTPPWTHLRKLMNDMYEHKKPADL